MRMSKEALRINNYADSAGKISDVLFIIQIHYSGQCTVLLTWTSSSAIPDTAVLFKLTSVLFGCPDNLFVIPGHYSLFPLLE